MKACRIVWPAVKKMALEKCELPPCGSDDVLIQTAYSVISPGTDLAWLQGQANTSNRFPQYPRYSASASVLEVGRRGVYQRLLAVERGFLGGVLAWQNTGENQ